ncbi:MAG: ABC transporter ATP-binding protein [Clostridiales bacterium]|jgi:oligopeptide/dipeptide ABC transporter ATP-binding protein|nr:ABC transporter ATP-binding protein [Clostridiales bacterium]
MQKNMGTNTKTPLLEAKNLKIAFAGAKGFIKAVEGIDFFVNEGECAAIVGESGCGKSVTALSVLKLLNGPPALYTADKLSFVSSKGEIDILSASETEMRAIRGNEISMIYQDASTSLNPVLTVGEQIAEMFLYHRGMNKKNAEAASVELMEKIGLFPAAKRFKQFPHELSGGMKQRILIAMATACKPRLMLADEPTTALDVTVQAQILKLIADLRAENGMAVLFITHDLGAVRAAADRVYVMYCGKIMEEGYTDELIDSPLHPYTKGLIGSVPDLDMKKGERLVQIPKNVPHPLDKPSGCFFSDRCIECESICKKYMPPLTRIGESRAVRCWKVRGV